MAGLEIEAPDVGYVIAIDSLNTTKPAHIHNILVRDNGYADFGFWGEWDSNTGILLFVNGKLAGEITIPARSWIYAYKGKVPINNVSIYSTEGELIQEVIFNHPLESGWVAKNYYYPTQWIVEYNMSG